MKEESYMIILPLHPEDIKSPVFFMDNLQKSDLIHVIERQLDKEKGLWMDLQIDDRRYQIVVNPTDVEIPQFVRLGHSFTQEELRMIDEAGMGLGVSMNFEGDPLVCFYDQLRILNVMIPEILAVMDCPSEKLLSGRWVSLAAHSAVLPTPRYLFTVQAIMGDNEEVWLHSHGMKRCGLYELEILCSDKEHYNDHYYLIENFAVRMLESKEPIKPWEAVFLAQLSNNNYLVATAIPWEEALKAYPQATLGTAEDRQDEVHSEDTYVIMFYRSPAEEEARIYTTVQEYDELLAQNPMFMISNKETDRMRRLAAERIKYMVRGFQNPENKVLAKIGLTTDEAYWGNESQETNKEHIWFEIQDVGDKSVRAVLTQDPYYVSGVKAGHVGTYPFEDITDWLIFTKERRIAPDDVYLMDMPK